MPSQGEQGRPPHFDDSAPGAEDVSPHAPDDPSVAALPPAWLVGSALFPFGFVVGFTVTAFPFLLTRLHVPVQRIAEISAIVMSPTFWGFLLSPLLDTGLTLRT